MPGGDRTGPEGEGPRTGRGMGYCAPGTESGWWPRRGAAWGWGRGRGFGLGMGRGWRRGYRSQGWRGAPGPWPYPEEADEQEMERLQAEASWLQQGLDAVRSRIDELKGGGKAE